MKKLLLISFVLLSQLGLGQEIYIEVSKEIVSVNERFTYTIITHKKGKVIAPDFEGFQILGPASTSQFTNYSNINGKQTQTTTYTHTYELIAKEMGIYHIDPAKLKTKKKTYKSEEIKIQVDSEAEAMEKKIGVADVYLTLSTSKSKVMVGEAFVATLKYYSLERPINIETFENGAAGGLWRQDLEDIGTTYQMTQERIKGNVYYVITLREELCIPMSAGKILIEPSYGSCIFQGADFFNQYRKDGYSNSVTVEVQNVPDDRPEDFNGLVGSFKLIDKLDKTKVSAGEAVEMTITIEGSGNLNAFDEPYLDLPKSFQRLDPITEESLTNTVDGRSGSISYTFSFTPKEKGTYKLKPYSFSYFDLKSRSFKTLETKEYTLKVSESKNGQVIVEKRGTSEDIPEDIYYIHDEKQDFFKEDEIVFGSFTYVIGIVSPLLLSIGFVFFKWRRENMSDEEKIAAKQKVAKKDALSEIAHAKTLINAGDEKEALHHLQMGLNNFFITKLQMNLSDLSKSNISSALSKKGVNPELLKSFDSCWSKIEMAQYAPVSGENLSAMIDESESLVDQLNQELG